MVGRSFMKGDSCCVLVLQLRVRCAGLEPSEKAAIPRSSIDCSHVDKFSPDLIWPAAIYASDHGARALCHICNQPRMYIMNLLATPVTLCKGWQSGSNVHNEREG